MSVHIRRQRATRQVAARRRLVVSLGSVLALVAALFGAVPAGSTPAAATPLVQGSVAQYGVATQLNVPVTMADGTVLRADVRTPAAAGTTTPAAGSFPVLLTQTPYGRGSVEAELSWFTQRGYITVSADVRGTGTSAGSWSPWAPIEGQDGAALANWAAALPHADGKVGLYGGSYAGINQIMTAAAVGPNSPIKAIFPLVAGNDLYRELVTMGGIPDSQFMSFWLTYTGISHMTAPLAEALREGSTQNILDTLTLEIQHLGGVAQSNLPILTGLLGGGAQAYDGTFWQQRRPADMLASVVANGVPAFLVGGWYDLFQRGALMNYAGLQNAWAGRPVGAPMTADQPVTDRYQLLMGPWYHDPRQDPTLDLPALHLRWYDKWLKGIDTGITGAANPNPLHVKELGTNRWLDTRAYPFTGADPTRLYLDKGRTGSAPASANDGGLSTTAPTANGSEWISWTANNSPCTRSTAQWLGGFIKDPACTDSNTARETGTGSLVYTTAPMTETKVLAGPIGATLYAQSNTPETHWVVTVTDVAPDGSSVPLSSGALAGSHRAIDPAKSWYAPDGSMLMPYHPSTQATTSSVPTNQVVRYDVEVFPTFASIAPGHRIRVNVTTADTPHLSATLTQTPGLLAGIWQLKSGPANPSSVTIPLAPASAFGTACTSVCP
ncbi:CocE/NonD family hydrolase [Embleya sp. NPDC059237]|uniref:CocE/NonD family hydrolase n=1 Tax=Embleya sp. NPDC059237 TaxID=3346784 RepID=UPI0036B78C25